MMPIRIEKNVPLPATKPSPVEIVPELGRMEVGDSIYIPNSPRTAFPPVGSPRIAAWGNEVGRRFRCQYDDNGLRVWRLE